MRMMPLWDPNCNIFIHGVHKSGVTYKGVVMIASANQFIGVRDLLIHVILLYHGMALTIWAQNGVSSSGYAIQELHYGVFCCVTCKVQTSYISSRQHLNEVGNAPSQAKCCFKGVLLLLATLGHLLGTLSQKHNNLLLHP
jgi:hypothetical protein